jgi:hypothetical protein
MVHFDARCCRMPRIGALRRTHPQSGSQRQHPRLRHFTGRPTRAITALYGSLRPNAPTNAASSRMVGLVLRKASSASTGEAEGFDLGPVQWTP